MPFSTPIIVPRLVVAVLLIALAEFCVFGFLTSLEPGDHLPFRIAYPVLGLFCFVAAMWLGFGAFKLQPRGLIQGIVGLCVGAAIAFSVMLLLFIAGPRGDFTHLWKGAGIASLGTPIGASIGGALGAWVGSRRANERADLPAK